MSRRRKWMISMWSWKPSFSPPNLGSNIVSGNFHYLSAMIVPSQEGGVNYKEQYEIIQLCNLALLDQINMLQHHNIMMKELLEVRNKIKSHFFSRELKPSRVPLKPVCNMVRLLCKKIFYHLGRHEYHH